MPRSLKGPFRSQWRNAYSFAHLPEHIVVIDGVVMADVAEFCMIGAHKFEDDTIGPVNSEALHFVVLRMELSHME